MKTMFGPAKLGGLTLKDRFVRSATYDGAADEHGHMTDAHSLFIKNWLKGASVRLLPDSPASPNWSGS